VTLGMLSSQLRKRAGLLMQPHMRNWKGYLSQNCLFVCDFDFLFTYTLTRWDGSTVDANLWNDAHTQDLRMPQGRYLLADAGFGTLDALLVPFRGVRYHLKEWRQAYQRYVLFCQLTSSDSILTFTIRPCNREELFNLQHASLRNMIECIFSVLKCQFCVLQLPLKYSMDIQA